MEKCRCGKGLDPKMVQVFGDFAICASCAEISTVARKAASAINIILHDLYALKGEDGMMALKKEISPTLAQFALK